MTANQTCPHVNRGCNGKPTVTERTENYEVLRCSACSVFMGIRRHEEGQKRAERNRRMAEHIRDGLAEMGHS